MFREYSIAPLDRGNGFLLSFVGVGGRRRRRSGRSSRDDVHQYDAERAVFSAEQRPRASQRHGVGDDQHNDQRKQGIEIMRLLNELDTIEDFQPVEYQRADGIEKAADEGPLAAPQFIRRMDHNAEQRNASDADDSPAD